MEVMVLKHPLKSVQPLYDSDLEMSPEEQDTEMSLILGGDLDSESRDRELQAHIDRIRMLEIELQKARAEAYQAGYVEGQNIEKTEAHKKFAQLTQQFGADIDALQSEFNESIDSLTAPLLKFALGVSEKLIQREIILNDAANEILRTQVQRVLNETISQSKPVVHVNISQLEWITGIEILKNLSAQQKGNLRFVSNPTIQPGECKLETEDLLVDSTIATQLDNLMKALLDSHAAD